MCPRSATTLTGRCRAGACCRERRCVHALKAEHSLVHALSLALQWMFSNISDDVDALGAQACALHCSVALLAQSLASQAAEREPHNVGRNMTGLDAHVNCAEPRLAEAARMAVRGCSHQSSARLSLTPTCHQGEERALAAQRETSFAALRASRARVELSAWLASRQATPTARSRSCFFVTSLAHPLPLPAAAFRQPARRSCRRGCQTG